MRVLFDTNILIDFLNGEEKAFKEIERFDEALISPLTWIEIMVGTKPEAQKITLQFLNQFKLVEINQKVASIAVVLRQQYKIKLPDAIIWASAKVHNAILITRDITDFSADEIDVRCPYKLDQQIN